MASTTALVDLRRFGTAPALVAATGTVGYAELADRVEERAHRLGGRRRLVLLECRNDVETVVTYLAALHGRHPVLLVGADCHSDELRATYRPEVVARGARLEISEVELSPDLHPDLAVLLSTSGSTGSPKLVRLSHENLRSNADAIAEYLHLTADDRAATSLPLQYCYGLSVLNSHLRVGASVLLTEASVVDEDFWKAFAAGGATSLAGVPHTFALLDSSGFAARDLPTLRTLTQAGGRLDPETVRRYARMGEERGFDLVVMYGQTEATARMAYLPPHLAAERPTSIGIPIPGGSFRIDPASGTAEGDGVGELVYTGENVMLGYAQEPADLALGRTQVELRTGDLARQDEDGLYELVGRRSRFAKLFGLRIDLDRVESLATAAGVNACVIERDGHLDAFVTRHRDKASVAEVLRGLHLPAHASTIHVVDAVPLTSHGKTDYRALGDHAAAVARDRSAARQRRAPAVTAERVRDLYAHLLGRPDATPEDSFVSLRGDSLSYVEASVRLGGLFPDLPADWAQRSARDLAAMAQRTAQRRSRWAPLEISVALRAVAIVLIVGSHANLFSMAGGAHVLLAVVGFNLARFQLAGAQRTERRRSLLRAARNVMVPSALWIGGVAVVTGMYDASTALLLNGVLGSDDWDVRWQFWFLEVVVWTLVGAALLFSFGAVDRWERARPFGSATSVFVAALALRYALVGIEAGPTERYALLPVLWCLALGWMAARSRTDLQRLVTSAASIVACWGFFADPVREGLVVAGVCLLVWVPRIPVPRRSLPLLSAVAASSLFTYLTHWQVYPHLEVDHPLLATLASFAVGIAVWRAYEGVVAGMRRRTPTAGAGPLYCADARLHRRRPDHGRARVVPQARVG